MDTEKTLDLQKQAALLEDNVAGMEEELTRKYYWLGKCVYEIADRKVDEINDLVDRLVEAKVRLCELKDRVVCPDCLRQNDKENLYCGHCGVALEK